MDAIEQFKAMRKANAETVERLRAWLHGHGLKSGGPCVIYGENGPRYWAQLSDHPKVRAKMGPREATSERWASSRL